MTGPDGRTDRAGSPDAPADAPPGAAEDPAARGSEVRLSVVIPTRNRPAELRRTLEATLDQLEGTAGEVVVVDDGSEEGALADVGALAEEASDGRLRLLRRPARGPAAARNAGIRAARGARILLLGDDTRPVPGCLARHAAEDLGEQGLQGRIDWDPEREITPLMAFLAPSGPQFYFDGLVAGRPVPWTAVLASNLSAPRAWFLDEPFDESFPHAAVEDTELAWRWQRRGREVRWAPDARCWHDHRYDDLDAFLERQRRAGRSARRAVRLHPAMAGRLILQPALFGVVVALRALVRTVLGRSRTADSWDLRCRTAFAAGWLGTTSSRASSS